MRTRREDLAEVASLLLFLQGAVAVSLAAETVGGGLLAGGGWPGALLSVAGAAATFALARGARRGRLRSLRWARRFQYGWILTGAFDMGLSVVLAGIGPAPVPVLTRIVLPVSIIVVLRRLRAASVPEAASELEVAA